MLKVDFCWHETIHPKSDDMPIVDLARILEENYDICENFCKWVEPKLEQKLMRWIDSNRTITTSRVNEEIKQLWREYGRAGKFGTSMIAKEEGRPAFVDTSTYMLDMYPICKFDKDLPLPIIDDTQGLRQ